MYNLVDHKITTVVLFDYSKVNTDKKQIKITDFTNNTTAFATPKSLTPEAEKVSKDLNKDVTQSVTSVSDQANDSKNSDDKVLPKYLVSCTVFECTKYKSYGGSADQGCKNFGNDLVCPIINAAVNITDKVPKGGKLAAAFYSTIFAIGCYVPKGKICVKGRAYHANACPMQA